MAAKTFPKTIGACVDKLYEMRQQRLALQREADEIKSEETALENHIFDSFSKTDLEGARGKLATASISRSMTYTIGEWLTFVQYVAKTKNWDLLRKQPSTTACRERFEAGKPVPGIEPLTKVSLSLTKRAS